MSAIDFDRYITRKRAGRYCTLHVKWSNGRLSITGEAGDVSRPAAARRQARDYWRSYFEDAPEEIAAMNERCGTRFRSPTAAARYVLASDGEFHGLDAREDGMDILIGHSFGQIPDELREWFPEAAPLLPWHLNDMHAECEHQSARGETYQTHPGAACPDCDYRLGSAWLKREVPADVIALARWVGVSP
jgi:hypothetical protein